MKWENNKCMYNETYILCELKIWSEVFPPINIMTNQNCNEHLTVQGSRFKFFCKLSFPVREWSDLNLQSVKQDSIHTCCTMEFLIPAAHNNCDNTRSSPDWWITHCQTPSHNGVLTVKNLPYLEEVLAYRPLQLYSACLVLYEAI